MSEGEKMFPPSKENNERRDFFGKVFAGLAGFAVGAGVGDKPRAYHKIQQDPGPPFGPGKETLSLQEEFMNSVSRGDPEAVHVARSLLSLNLQRLADEIVVSNGIQKALETVFSERGALAGLEVELDRSRAEQKLLRDKISMLKRALKEKPFISGDRIPPLQNAPKGVNGYM